MGRSGGISSISRNSSDNSDPLVTVVLTHYDHIAFVHGAIESIVFQTYQNWELIVVNDNTNYNLGSVCLLDKRIRVLQTTGRQGQSVCVNEACKVAQGTHIAMHDSDDWSSPFRLRMSMDYIKATGADFLHADFIKVGSDGKQTYYSAGDFTDKNVLGGSTSAFGTVVVKKDLLAKYPMPAKVPYCNDLIWYTSLLSGPIKTCVCHVPLYYYRTWTSGFVKSSRFRFVQEHRRHIEHLKLKKYLLDKGIIRLKK